MASRLRPYLGKLSIIIGAIALMIFAWANLLVNVNIDAHAATMQGVGNQVEGKVDKGVGTVKRAAGDATDNYSTEIKGAAQQVRGDVKQGLGTAENKLDDAKNTAEDTSESLIDSVKDFFD